MPPKTRGHVSATVEVIDVESCEVVEALKGKTTTATKGPVVTNKSASGGAKRGRGRGGRHATTIGSSTGSQPVGPLVGRETEFATIVAFVEGHRAATRADVLFVTGACGCGKTSTIAAAEAAITRGHSDVTWRYVNCAGLTQKTLVQHVWDALAGDVPFLAVALAHIRSRIEARVVERKAAALVAADTGRSSGGRLSGAAAVSVFVSSDGDEVSSPTGSGARGSRGGAAQGSRPSAGNRRTAGPANFLRPFEDDLADLQEKEATSTGSSKKSSMQPRHHVLVMDEAEFSDPSCQTLQSAVVSLALEHPTRLSLILISNARSLSILPSHFAGSAATTELVFGSYSTDGLRAAARAYFAASLSAKAAAAAAAAGTQAAAVTGGRGRGRGGRVVASTPSAAVPVPPPSLDALLAPSALDYAVKVAITNHSADLRKVIAMCENAMDAHRTETAAAAAAALKQQEAAEAAAAAAANAAGARKGKNTAAKRPRPDETSEPVDASPASGAVAAPAAPANPAFSALAPPPPLPPALPQAPAPVSLRQVMHRVSDLQVALDQISALPLYTRQLLKALVDLVRRTGSFSYMPSALQLELWKRTDAMLIPRPSSAAVLEGLEDLRGAGFVTCANTVQRHKLYTLSWPLAELEPRLATIKGFDGN